MNSNLNDFTPSKELDLIMRYHYSQTRAYIQMNGGGEEKKEQLKELFQKLLSKKLPDEVLNSEESIEHTKKLHEAIDLAFEDYEARQKDKDDWTRF